MFVAGGWMDAPQNKQGFGFSHRGFASSEAGPDRFIPPPLEEIGRGRGGHNLRGRGRGFQHRTDDPRGGAEDLGAPSPKRMSRWSNLSPPLTNVNENIQTADMISTNNNNSSTTLQEGLSIENIGQSVVEGNSSEQLAVPNSNNTQSEMTVETRICLTESFQAPVVEPTSHDFVSTVFDKTNEIDDIKSSVVQSSTTDSQQEGNANMNLYGKEVQDVQLAEYSGNLNTNEVEIAVKESSSNLSSGFHHFDVEQGSKMSLEEKLPLHEQCLSVEQTSDEPQISEDRVIQLNSTIPFESVHRTERRQSSEHNKPCTNISEHDEKRLSLASDDYEKPDNYVHQSVDFDDMSLEAPPTGVSSKGDQAPSEESEFHDLNQSVEASGH